MKATHVFGVAVTSRMIVFALAVALDAIIEDYDVSVEVFPFGNITTSPAVRRLGNLNLQPI